MRRLVSWIQWFLLGSHILALVAVAATLRLEGRYWLGTVLAFAPAWVYLVPTGLLFGLFAIRCWHLSRRARVGEAGALVVAVGIWLFGIAGLTVSWPSSSSDDDGARVRLMTYNLGGMPRIGIPSLVTLMQDHRVDIGVFQECNPGPEGRSFFDGYTLHQEFGLCYLSRIVPKDIVVRDPSDYWAQAGSGVMSRYDVETELGPVSIVNAHLETPRAGLEAMVHERLRGIETLHAVNRQRQVEAAELARWSNPARSNLVIAGDLNMPAYSALIRENFSGLVNAYSESGVGFGDTKLTKWHSVRIDHVLFNARYQAAAADVVDGIGGDHRPLIVSLRRP
jgi:endonuclease/exonuclease/phosphatase family metal-dependent hydrolase